MHLIKPRLKKDKGLWVCRWGWVVGVGETPASAYLDWKWEMKRQERESG